LMEDSESGDHNHSKQNPRLCAGILFYGEYTLDMKQLITIFHKYEKWITPVALVGGFVIDNFTLRRTDALIENVVIFCYLLFLMAALLIWHSLRLKNIKTVRTIELEYALLFVIQFIFGGLFSALTVFYIKSASWWASWPFLLVL